MALLALAAATVEGIVALVSGCWVVNAAGKVYDRIAEPIVRDLLDIVPPKPEELIGKYDLARRMTDDEARTRRTLDRRGLTIIWFAISLFCGFATSSRDPLVGGLWLFADGLIIAGAGSAANLLFMRRQLARYATALDPQLRRRKEAYDRHQIRRLLDQGLLPSTDMMGKEEQELAARDAADAILYEQGQKTGRRFRMLRYPPST